MVDHLSIAFARNQQSGFSVSTWFMNGKSRSRMEIADKGIHMNTDKYKSHGTFVLWSTVTIKWTIILSQVKCHWIFYFSCEVRRNKSQQHKLKETVHLFKKKKKKKIKCHWLLPSVIIKISGKWNMYSWNETSLLNQTSHGKCLVYILHRSHHTDYMRDEPAAWWWLDMGDLCGYNSK